jgi:anthranilate synthase component 1
MSMSTCCKRLMADRLSPALAFEKLARDSKTAFLLESVEKGETIGRYSFIGADPEDSFSGSLEGLRSWLPEPIARERGLPIFTGGAVCIFTYEMTRELESLPDLGKRREAFQPAVSVLADYYKSIVAFDHARQQLIIISCDSMESVREIERRLSLPSDSPPLPEIPETTAGKYSSNMTETEFTAAVLRSKELIASGDIFQVVLSQRFDMDFSGDPFLVYRALRQTNPSPYMFYCRRDGLTVAGSSPEMLVRVLDGKVSYRPIAGTRRRGHTAEEDRELEEELLNDEKERAEHVMLVDVGRNDVGRVCTYGSVKVERFMFVERYSHVMHLVSEVTGSLRPELRPLDALAACFPAGTVTGAPKIRAMEIIEELEPSRRGIYAGAIGYIDASGDIDTCIAIRTIIIQDGKAYVQAGAGIVADSDPCLENKECHHKARALINAIELARSLESEGNNGR